jgi:lipopolysaccharide/colanic/teichoic acid biosynthesis glycosyltransferase
MHDSSHSTVCPPGVSPAAPSPDGNGLLRESGARAGGPNGAPPGARTALSRSREEAALLRKPALRVRHPWYEPVKRGGEFLAALVLLILAAPVVLAAAVLVKLTSPGPAFYGQTRVGRQGRPFRIYKLRTMIDGCESLSGPCWSKPGDPRITPLGHFLRRTHVDELPQLLNVLSGQMGLVGPRPERPEFLPVLEQALAGYRDRLLVRPGVTGLAQVQLPPDTDLASVRRKLAYDLLYIERHNPWLDAKILIATAFKVLHVPFELSGRLLGFPPWEAIEQGRTGPPPGAPPERAREMMYL